MAKWIEVPAHRILEVEWKEFHEGYVRIAENGEVAKSGEHTSLILRKQDGRVFKRSKFAPAVDPMDCKPVVGSIYLMEI